ncbi:MAG: hypothetical protein ACUVTD_01045 [Nitrososphaerales archaeon]
MGKLREKLRKFYLPERDFGAIKWIVEVEGNRYEVELRIRTMTGYGTDWGPASSFGGTILVNGRIVDQWCPSIWRMGMLSLLKVKRSFEIAGRNATLIQKLRGGDIRRQYELIVPEAKVGEPIFTA